MRVIFDSNVFDDIIAGRLDVSVLIRKRVKIYITHIQKDELAACRNVNPGDISSLIFILKQQYL